DTIVDIDKAFHDSKIVPDIIDTSPKELVKVSGGHIVTGYSGPHPPEGTGLHRYVVLIYQQPGLHINPPPRDDEHRRSFSIKDFAKNYTLGEPVLACSIIAFQNDSIVPDVLDACPLNTARVTFPENVTITFGTEITPAQASKEPHVEWPSKQCAMYTLAMVDPDAPSRVTPTNRNVKHWLVMNIPAGQVYGGDIVAGFVGPAPPEGTGLHRYAILIYQQPDGRIDPPPRDDSHEHRIHFSIEDFARNYTLGEPVAGNFFLAQHQK
ncbi:unnamed protein product, partial [Oppiella nova]